MRKYIKYIPGLLFVFVISMLSVFINDSIKSFINLEALTIAIVIGILINNTVGTPENCVEGSKFALKKLLKLGIILLGLKLNIQATLELGPKVLLMVILFIPTVLCLAALMGKLFKINPKLSTLIGVGSSICGASAIVAMAPCINADDDDAIISVSIVSLLGAIGVIIYSMVITNIVDITPVQYGVWSGLSLQGVAHAIAAAFAMGDVSGEVGTIVKMTRVLMLVPVSLSLGFIFNKDNKSGAKTKFPTYVLFFILAGVINSLGILPIALVDILKQISKLCILMAMTGMGLAVDFHSILNKGIKALIMGSILFIIISGLSLMLVFYVI